MESASLEERISLLGQELKQWEQQFATSHAGIKPTREDIKQEAAIAARYSEYRKLRETCSGKGAEGAQYLASKKRKSSGGSPISTNRCSRPNSTPSKTRKRQDLENVPVEDADEGINGLIASCTFVGPTPQKDGRVLGLFDLLPEHLTPSKGSKEQAQIPRVILDTVNVNTVASTPTKARASPSLHTRLASANEDNDPLHTTSKHSRTPQSSGKRFLLDHFVTPSKRRRLNEAATPQSHHKLVEAATPSFLQRSRSKLPPILEDTSATDPNEPSNWMPNMRPAAERKRLTRSFSSMIAEIRRAEDDRLDEELEMMREMEGEGLSSAHQGKPPHTKNDVLVEDSQAVNMLGPDGTGPLSDDEGDSKEGLGRDGRPLKVWTKKGQKRQTRRVIMRPTTKANVSRPLVQDPLFDGSPDDAREVDMGTKRPHQSIAGAADTRAEGDADEADGNFASKQQDENGKGFVQRAVKKISATAHANFRRLKIKSSKGAKASGRGRFGRGRR